MDWMSKRGLRVGWPMNAPMPTGHGCHRVTLAAVPWSVEQSTESDNNHSFRAAARRDLVLGPPANVVSL